MGNLGLVYFIHKAKRKARNPKPSTQYFPAELLPDGNWQGRQVGQDVAQPIAKVGQDPVPTWAKNCTTYADKPPENQRDTQITNTLTPKNLLNYNTQARPSSLLKRTARELQPPPAGNSQANLDARRRELLQQAERIKRDYPTKERSPGKVVEIQPREAIA